MIVRLSSTLLCLLLSLMACRSHTEKDPLDGAVALVDAVPISGQEFKRALSRMRFDDEEGVPLYDSAEPNKQAILDDLVNRRLLVRDAERFRISISTDEVEAAYARAASGWNALTFEKELSNRDITPAEFRAELRELLVVSRYFRDHVFARLAVTDSDIDAFLLAHPDLLSTPASLRLRQVLTKTQDQADKIARDLRAGLGFEDAAMKHSQGPEGKVGGDLGTIQKGDLPRELEEEAFKLRPGEVSKPIATRFGFHLLKVVSRKEAAERPMPEARELAETKLRQERERTAREAKIEELRRAATIVVKEDQIARIH